MYVDAFNEFSNAQAVTTTAISTNVIDLHSTTIGNTLRDIGTGEEVYLVVQTASTVTDVGSDATLTLTLESDSAAALDSSATVHFSTGALAFAAFATAGSTVACIRLPAGDYERYLGLRYTIGSGPLTGGTFDAFLTKDVQKWRAYADNVTIAANA